MSNSSILLKNGTIFNAFEKPVKKDILITNGAIVEIANNIAKNNAQTQIIDAEELIITAGLIDQHIHGGFGVNFNNCSTEEVLFVLEEYVKYGITSVVPTIMTDLKEKIKKQIQVIKEAKSNDSKNKANLIGVHLEGPFLNPLNKGIHPENSIQLPTIDNFKYFEDEIIKIVTYAPELDKNLEFTEYLTKKNIISSAGHSKADENLISHANKIGLKQLTHLFNAMSPLHHRTPGIIGEGLVNDNLYVEIIADGLHLHPIILEIIFRTKPHNKIIFISDSLPLTFAKTDKITFGGQEIYNKENNAVNKDGTFAGSLIFLDSALRNLSKGNIDKFLSLLPFATLNPAMNLGLAKKGFIKVGNDADIVLWDKNQNFKITKTIIQGVIVYQ